ncbi:MAG: hypothetical protein WA731_10030 [Pseudonocardiaceae bacterium]
MAGDSADQLFVIAYGKVKSAEPQRYRPFGRAWAATGHSPLKHVDVQVEVDAAKAVEVG